MSGPADGRWRRDRPPLFAVGSGPENTPKATAPDGLAARPRKLEVHTFREFCALPDPPTEGELLGPLVVRGQRLVLGGHTGEGKTTLALQIVRAIVSAGPFLDWNGAGGRALILDAEQGPKTVKRRLREAGLEQSDQGDYVRVADGLSLDSDEGDIQAVQETLERGRYDLVVADPLYKLHRGDSNDERAAVDLMRTLDAWREEHDFALILPVHCRKPQPKSRFSIHDLFGSTAYTRGAEVVLGLERKSDGYARLHFLKDRDGDLPISTAWGLVYDREDGFRRNPDDGRKETAVDRIRALVEQDPSLKAAQLAEMTGCSKRTAERALNELAVETAEALFNE